MMIACSLMNSVLLEGAVASVANSPFIVPVSGTLMILGIVVAVVWSGVRRREMESQERLAAIARGLVPATTPEAVATGQERLTTVARQRDTSRRAGLVLSFLGVGLVLFGLVLTWIVREREVFTVAAAGLFPLAIGVGFLIDAGMKSRDLELATLPGGGTDLRPLH